MGLPLSSPWSWNTIHANASPLDIMANLINVNVITPTPTSIDSHLVDINFNKLYSTSHLDNVNVITISSFGIDNNPSSLLHIDGLSSWCFHTSTFISDQRLSLLYMDNHNLLSPFDINGKGLHDTPSPYDN